MSNIHLNEIHQRVFIILGLINLDVRIFKRDGKTNECIQTNEWRSETYIPIDMLGMSGV